jgi:UDP-3-O-[3-hydroxymyristoyl] glucosamine N-acyltransferase
MAMSAELNVDEAIAVGALILHPEAQVSRFAVIRPADELGATRPVDLGPAATVGAFTVLHGGVSVGSGTRVEDHCVLGQPERGYALRRSFTGAGADTTLGDDVVVRAGVVLYAGVHLDDRSSVGHQTVLRTDVRVGPDTSLGHTMTIEREVTIGARVRCSPGSHLTAQTRVGDTAFLGAGIRTINDNGLDWAPGGGTAPLTPPRFDTAPASDPVR